MKGRGFTLIELMIALVVLAILLSIAYPAYQEQVRKSRRAQAKAWLLDIAAQEERYFTENNTYTDDLKDLGFNTKRICIDAHGKIVGCRNNAKIYRIFVRNPTTSCPIATCYDLRAVPLGDQLKDKEDGTPCKPIRLLSDGHKWPAQCW